MVLSWFAGRVSPIAVDIGTDTLKLLQVEPKENQHRLVAAASETIPEEVRGKSADRDAFVADALKRLLADGFKGRQVVTCLPSSHMAVQHIRVGKMSTEELAKALPFEAAGKLPFDPHRAVLRHTVAGEVYQHQETKQEIILMAAPRDAVDRHLALLSRAKLEVVGIHVEPTALIECFAHLSRRKGDENISTLFIDMGAAATHVVIAHGKNLAFAKHISVGGDTFNRRVAEAMKLDIAAARELRVRAGQNTQAARLPAGVLAISGAAEGHPLGRTDAGGAPDAEAIEKIARALADPLEHLITELRLCIRYYESIYPARTDGGAPAINRVIFVGGESRYVALCQNVAQKLGLPATLGDPLARLVKDSTTKSTVDLRQPQPGWAIAAGLAVGLAHAPAAAEREAS
jgi:type IV pilus assembly protein PilM